MDSASRVNLAPLPVTAQGFCALRLTSSMINFEQSGECAGRMKRPGHPLAQDLTWNSIGWKLLLTLRSPKLHSLTIIIYRIPVLAHPARDRSRTVACAGAIADPWFYISFLQPRPECR